MSPLRLNGSTSGYVELTAPAVAGNVSLTLPSTAGNVVVNGANSAIVSGTAQNSTSGTSIDFTGIPSWVKRVTVTWAGLSTSGSTYVFVRLGTVSGVETTGYAGGAAYTGISSSGVTTTAGFYLNYGTGQGDISHGSMIINLLNPASNLWQATTVNGFSTTNYASMFGGSKSLAGVLTRLQIVTGNGTDTFDAGSINILYE
jgi:hypothetical protein